MEDALALAYIFAAILFIAILLIRSKRYFVKKSVSGEVLLKIPPSGLKKFEISLYLSLYIVPAVWVSRWFAPEALTYMRVKMWLLLNLWIIIAIVFGLFPTKVCENGIIESYNYVSWSNVKSYSRLSDTYVILYLDKLHILSTKLKLRHPPEYRDKIDAILSESIGAQQA